MCSTGKLKTELPVGLPTIPVFLNNQNVIQVTPRQNAVNEYGETRKQFESENHEKAWLIRVASNICKNMLKAACRKNEPLNDNIPDSNISNEAKELLSELSKLPDKLKIPVYLFYYDGYSSEEIGQMLHISSSAVRTRLQKARERLRNVLGDERSVE